MRLRLTKIAIFLAALVPLERLVWKALHDGLGANPIEFITHSTGDWTLILILTTLSITTFRLLLRHPALPDLHLARQVLRLSRNGERHSQASLHHRRILRFRPPDSAGPDLDRLVDSPTRRQELAAPAPSDLSHGNPRRGALLLAGKGRPPQAHRVRHRARPPAPLPGRSLVFRKSLRKEQAARPPSPRPESPVETGLASSPAGC